MVFFRYSGSRAQARAVAAEALDPLGRPRMSRYGLLSDGTAVVEMARESEPPEGSV